MCYRHPPEFRINSLQNFSFRLPVEALPDEAWNFDVEALFDEVWVEENIEAPLDKPWVNVDVLDCAK